MPYPPQGNVILGAIAQNLLPDSADARDIGSAAREWRTAYIGEAGGVYFGLAQDILLSRLAADVLGVAAGDGFVAPGGLGAAATQLHTIPAVAADTLALVATAQTLTNKTLTSPDINAGRPTP